MNSPTELLDDDTLEAELAAIRSDAQALSTRLGWRG